MKKTRAQFKLALRYCRQNVEEMKANACAQGLLPYADDLVLLAPSWSINQSIRLFRNGSQVAK